MEETKYGKYIITETPQNMAHPDKNSILLVNKELDGKIKGANYLSIGMVTKKDGDDVPLFKPHNHDFDEYLIFLGTNPENPSDLGGEVELWLGEDEKHILTKSCAVFVPRGLYHTPLTFKRVDKPILMIRTGNTDEDRHLSHSEQERWADLPVSPQYNID